MNCCNVLSQKNTRKNYKVKIDILINNFSISTEPYHCYYMLFCAYFLIELEFYDVLKCKAHNLCTLVPCMTFKEFFLKGTFK